MVLPVSEKETDIADIYYPVVLNTHIISGINPYRVAIAQLRAIIAVREGDCQGALNYLSAAIDQKPELAEAAANNIEFAPLFENPEFLALM